MKRSSYFAIGASLVVLFAVFYFFSDIVAYILIAWVLSMIGQPVMNFYKNYLRLGNNGGAAMTLITFIFLIAVLFWMFIPPIVQQARNLANVDYAKVVESLEDPINRLNNILVEKGLMEGKVIGKDSLTTLPNDSLSSYEMDTTTTIIPREKVEDSPPIDPLVIDSVQQDSSDRVEKAPDNLPEIFIAPDSSKVIAYPSIGYDTLIFGKDTITKNNISINIEIYQPPPKIEKPVVPIDTSSAAIKKTDTPIEKVQKKLFSAFNPAQIPTLFSSVVGFMGNLLIAIASILFITFFFLREQKLFANFIKALVPNQHESKVIHAVDDSSRLLRRYFVGISIQVTIITLFMWILLSIIGIKSALLVAFFAAMINVIPYIGPVIGAIFGLFITISSNLELSFYSEMLPMLLLVVGAFAAMQMLDNFILQPYIFSTSVLAHPLEIFIIILAGAKLGGIAGMVLAIPTYTVIRVIAKSFLSEFKIVQKMTQKMDAQIVENLGEEGHTGKKE